jgi:hypothetical protein
VENPRRIGGHQLDETRQRDRARVDQSIERQRHGRLEPGDAERRPIELDVLLIVVMRRVIGGDHVDGAVDDSVHHGVAIQLVAKRRIHLDVGVVGPPQRQHLVCEDEMMRRHFTG